MQDLMTTAATTIYATEIADLPEHDTPPGERQTWLTRKVQLLAAVEAVEPVEAVEATR